VVFQEIVAEKQELRALRDSLVAAGAGDQVRAHPSGSDVESDLWAKRERDASQILASCGLWRTTWRSEMARDDGARRCFLVSAERQGEFDQRSRSCTRSLDPVCVQVRRAAAALQLRQHHLEVQQ